MTGSDDYFHFWSVYDRDERGVPVPRPQEPEHFRCEDPQGDLFVGICGARIYNSATSGPKCMFCARMAAEHIKGCVPCTADGNLGTTTRIFISLAENERCLICGDSGPHPLHRTE